MNHSQCSLETGGTCTAGRLEGVLALANTAAQRGKQQRSFLPTQRIRRRLMMLSSSDNIAT
jgi:hypothetical protein